MIKQICLGLITCLACGMLHGQANNLAIATSRSSALKVTNSSVKEIHAGGFVLNDSIVVTTLDAIGSVKKIGKATHFTLYRDVNVIFENGDTVQARCISVPSRKDLAPIKYNFALLQLDPTYVNNNTWAPIYSRYRANAVGTILYFSGFRDTSLTLSTQRGMLSGFSKSSTFLSFQGPHNVFLNGSALFNSSGEVVGIISTRFNALRQELRQQMETFEDEIINGTYSNRQNFKTLQYFDRSLEINLGNAININYLRSYLIERGIDFKE